MFGIGRICTSLTNKTLAIHPRQRPLPGGTKTGMAGNDPDFHAYVVNLQALRRMAEPRKIA